MTEENVGKLLKRLLAEKGLSQRKLAKLSGVDRGYINSLIKGRAGSITIRILRQLAEALMVEPEIFLQSVSAIPEETPLELMHRALVTFPDTIPIFTEER